MQEQQKLHLNQLGIYRKSMEVFHLSRRIVDYITDDKDVLSLHKSNKDVDIYADRLVMNSLSLVPKIVETENEKNASLKLKFAKSIRCSIDKLQQDCKDLEQAKIHGKEFIGILKKELKKLQAIHCNYVNSLIQL